jgi:hypothetical protein
MKSPMADMRLSNEDKLKQSNWGTPSIKDIPDYPYGLSLCLGDEQLDKINLDPTKLSAGAFIDLRCMAMVSSVSESMVNGEPCYRVELQITHIAADNEDDEETPKSKISNKRPYF